MIEELSSQLSNNFDKELVDKLLKCYTEMRYNFYLGKCKPTELEGGRFAETAMRMLQQIARGSYTPLNTPLPNFPREVEKFSNLSASDFHDSI